jgi:diguanylate cyclase (GGDEF)-like protein
VLHVRAVADVREAQLRHIVVVTADVTAERAHVDRLVEQATRDALTGLFNRQRFLDDVGAALERRRHRARGVVAVLFIDVDDLKSTNDRFGHDSGDRLLREVAIRIVAAVRPADIVARYGGDEFTVLCEELEDFAEAAEIADRIVDRVYRCGNGDQPHSISIGVAVAEDPGVDPVQIVADADQAMYRVKRWNQPDAITLPKRISPSTGRR